MESMRAVTERGTRREQLQALALVIADAIDEADGMHSMAQLARQYRETIAELNGLDETEGGELDAILADGQPAAVRPRRASL